MMKVLLTIASLCLWLCHTADAQQWEPYFKRYGPEDGLETHAAIYHIFQDSKGYIWASSNYGVSRFDGENFKHYKGTDDGFAERATLRGYEDGQGILWFIGLAGKITCGKNGRFYPYPHSEKLSGLLAWGKWTSIVADSIGTLHIGAYGRGYVQIDSTGKMIEVCTSSNSEQGIYFTKIAGEPFCFYVSPAYRANEFCPIYRYSKDTCEFIANLYNKENIDEQLTHTVLRIAGRRNGSVLISKGRFILEITDDNNITAHEVDGPITSMLEDSRGGIWVSSIGYNGVAYFPDGQIGGARRELFLEDVKFHWAMESHDKGIWLAPASGGIFHRPTPFIEVMPEPYPLIDSLGPSFDWGSDIVFGSSRKYGGRLSVYNGITSRSYQIDRERFSIRLMMHDTIKQQVYVRGGERRLFLLSNDGMDTLLFNGEHPAGICTGVCNDPDGLSRWIAAGVFLYKSVDNKLVLKSDPCPYNIVSVAFFDSAVYAGTINGLWKYKGGEWIDLRQLHSSFDGLIAGLTVFNNALWVFNNVRGTTFLNGAGQINSLTFNDVPIKYVLGSGFIGDTMALLSSLGGMYLVNEVESGRGFRIRVIPILPNSGNELKYFSTLKSRYLILSEPGLMRLDYQNYPSHSLVELALNDVWVNGKRFLVKPLYVLPHDSNNIRIDFVKFSYVVRKNGYFEYRMSGLEDWTKTEEPSIRFTTLPTGNYQFDIRARNVLGEVSEIKTIHFNILPPYYATWWFRTLMVLLVLLLGWLVFRWQIGQVKKRSRLLNELQHSQHQALAARMNPHFIFNALNSIQQFTLKNDQKSAAAYMRDYAHLMRLVLENSSENLVSLESELEAIRIYLDLERLRSGEKISYRVELSQDLDTSRFVLPALLLQPYLENAVWHGLMPKEPPGGNILIRLDGKNGRLQVEIEDNGIGRARASELKTGNHPGFASQGTGINERRMQLIKSLYKISISVKTVDVTDMHEPGIKGTKVIIIIPQPD